VEAGRRIGKYVLGERIAVGGMAEVWAAHAEGREGFVKPVALKFMLESFSGDPELERLFVNEARIAARLQHANLVTVFDFDKVTADEERGIAGRYYIAMERVEGQDLRRLLESARTAGYVFPVSLALYVAGEVLKALRYVHEKREKGRALGLVHRDVSPHNVLVAYSGEVKLSDFGIAKAREHSVRTTKPGNLRGKIAYASPEQLAGGTVDHRTDQFAAGVTIWEMLAGRRLFDGTSDLEIIGKVARCEIPALPERDARREVPAAVEAVVRRMLAAEPAARFPTTADAMSAMLALPGYSPDGAPLGEVARALFQTSGVGLSRTVPLELVGAPRASAAAAGAPTRTMGGGAPETLALEAPPPKRRASGARRVVSTPAVPEAPPPPKVRPSGARRAVSAPAAPAHDFTVESDDVAATTDVRSVRGVVRILGALALGAGVAGAILARRHLGFGDTSTAAPAATVEREAPVAAVALPPSPNAAPPVPPSPRPTPSARPLVASSPPPNPVAGPEVGAPLRASVAAGPVTSLASGPRVPVAAAPPSGVGRRAGRDAPADRGPAAPALATASARAAEAPGAAAPAAAPAPGAAAPPPRAPEPPARAPEPAPATSPNHAPIIE
jgi:serine/threonine-protein kinase